MTERGPSLGWADHQYSQGTSPLSREDEDLTKNAQYFL